jgi:hypothetical protein
VDDKEESDGDRGDPVDLGPSVLTRLAKIKSKYASRDRYNTYKKIELYHLIQYKPQRSTYARIYTRILLLQAVSSRLCAKSVVFLLHAGADAGTVVEVQKKNARIL